MVEKLETLRLHKAAATLRSGVDETLSYYAFPAEPWRHIKTNNMLERVFVEIRRRTGNTHSKGISSLARLSGTIYYQSYGTQFAHNRVTGHHWYIDQ